MVKVKTDDLTKQLKLELEKKVKNCMIKPSLALIEIGTNEFNKLYINKIDAFASEVGMHFRHFTYNVDVSEREIMNKIVELNNDEYINGIVFIHSEKEFANFKRIINSIDVNKDIEGITDKSLARLFNNRKGFVPCIVEAVNELIIANDIDLASKNVTIIGRSNCVGKPLAHIMNKNNATVTLCHSKTNDLKNYTKNADILFVATGNKNLITKDMVKDEAVVFDIGRNYIDGKLYGDVCSDVTNRKPDFSSSDLLEEYSIAILFKHLIGYYNGFENN